MLLRETSAEVDHPTVQGTVVAKEYHNLERSIPTPCGYPNIK